MGQSFTKLPFSSSPSFSTLPFPIPLFHGNNTTITPARYLTWDKKDAPGQRTAPVGSELWDAAHLHQPSWAGKGTQQQLLTPALLPTAGDVQPKQGKSLSNAMKVKVRALEPRKMFLKVDCPT